MDIGIPKPARTIEPAVIPVPAEEPQRERVTPFRAPKRTPAPSKPAPRKVPVKK